MEEGLLTEVDFADLDLNPSLMEGLRAAGFERCTPIQARSLPLLLEGRDIIAGQAQTGTGKTAAFLLAGMRRLLSRKVRQSADWGQPRAIILSPTRELAIQIHRDATVLSGATALRLGLVYGSVDYDKQRRAVAEGIDILIGTPGGGAAGDAISLACEEYVFSLQSIEEYLGHKLPVRQATDDLLVELNRPHRVARREPPERKRRRLQG